MAEQPPKKPAGNTPSKPAAPAGSQPKAAPKAQPKAPAAEDNSFLLNIGGAPAASNPCPNCQQPMKPGSKLCVSCGFNLDAGTATKTHVMRAKRASGGGGGGVPSITFGPATKVALVVAALISLPVILGSLEKGSSLGMVGLIIYMIVGLVTWIWTLVEGFQAGLISGVLCFFFWPYQLYFVFFKSENSTLKGLHSGIMLAVISLIFYAANAEPRQSRGPNTGISAQGSESDEQPADSEPDGAAPTPAP
jgi:hypothetical protein